MIFEVLWPRAGGVPECSYSVPGTSGAWIGDAPHRGDEVRHEATPLPRPSGHRMAESVADLIYGQIHLYPSEVHLGLLSGMEALDVVLWNATFAPVQLVGVNSASSAGTTLSGFPPGVRRLPARSRAFSPCCLPARRSRIRRIRSLPASGSGA